MKLFIVGNVSPQIAELRRDYLKYSSRRSLRTPRWILTFFFDQTERSQPGGARMKLNLGRTVNNAEDVIESRCSSVFFR